MMEERRRSQMAAGFGCGWFLAAGWLLGLGGCVHEGRDRARLDDDVGIYPADSAANADMAANPELNVKIEVAEGLAQVLEVSNVDPDGQRRGFISLWAGAPDFRMKLDLDGDARRDWRLSVQNAMPDAMPLVVDLAAGEDADAVDITDVTTTLATERAWDLVFPDGPLTATVRIAPLDVDLAPVVGEEIWRFAVMGDVQGAMSEVGDVFARINQVPDLRFVVSTGDITENARLDEYALWQRKLRELDIPYYSTIGNHELFNDAARWHVRFGRFSTHFRFKGAAFTLLDSAGAGLDATVYDMLDGWLPLALDDVHMVFTHYPPYDPIGVRQGSFRSRREAAKLLSRLAAGNVDVTFYGHIHSYYSFSNADIPAYISGGGGAVPERWDGIGRHFLVVEVGADRVESVAVVRVDGAPRLCTVYR